MTYGLNEGASRITDGEVTELLLAPGASLLLSFSTLELGQLPDPPSLYPNRIFVCCAIGVPRGPGQSRRGQAARNLAILTNCRFFGQLECLTGTQAILLQNVEARRRGLPLGILPATETHKGEPSQVAIVGELDFAERGRSPEEFFGPEALGPGNLAARIRLRNEGGPCRLGDGSSVLGTDGIEIVMETARADGYLVGCSGGPIRMDLLQPA